MHPAAHQLLSNQQTALFIIGALVPLVGYLANHYLPWRSEAAKGIVHVVLAAAAGAIYKGVEAGNVGWNGATAQAVLTAVVAALGAHHVLWKPSTISARLGAGTNASDDPAR